MGNEESGKVHSLFYSLILSAILNGLNPRTYMHYIITKLHAMRRGDVAPETLLPHVINKSLLEDFSEKLLTDSKLILNTMVV